MEIKLLKKFPLGVNGEKFMINPIEMIRKQFFSFVMSFLKYALKIFKITNTRPLE